MHMTRESNESNETTKASPKRERGGVGGASHEAFLADASGSLRESADFNHLTLTITFPGSNDVLPEGSNPQTAKFNYFVGGEGRSTASDVPSFGEVVYANLYDGIDLHVMGNDDGVLKYEFHVAPGAEYAQIRIAYDGVDSLCIDEAGNLQINTSFGTLADGAPVVWQASGTRRTDISARFELCDDHTYRIALDCPVDAVRELVIDPDVQWALYLGGSDVDDGPGVAIDRGGNILVSGATLSVDFEGRNNSHHGGPFGPYDAFVAKVNSTGTLEWMTYLGGSMSDASFGVALDSAGNAYVAGGTESVDFAGRTNEFHGGDPFGGDAFIAKVASSGDLDWMTYLGSTGHDLGFGIAVDATGNSVVSGEAGANDFEHRNNEHHGGVADSFAASVRSDGVVQWMTYLGGSGGELGFGVSIDGLGHAIITGITVSLDFEGRINAHHGPWYYDAYVAKLTTSGALQWMTYVGGTADDLAYAIDTDDAGNAFLTGTTYSADFEGRNNSLRGIQYNAFLVKVTPTGLVQWMTYLGGSNGEDGRAVTVDEDGNAYVTGQTYSEDFEGRVNEPHIGPDAFLAQVPTSGAIAWMRYVGGNNIDSGLGIAVDNAGTVVISGQTASTDFEHRVNNHHGGRDPNDAFLVKIRVSSGLQLSVAATCPSGGPIQVSWSGATGGGTIVLLYAINTGSFRIPSGNPCAGTQTGLGSNQIQIAYQGSAGQSGSRTVNSTTGPGPCGGYLQLLDIATCGTSNVVRIE
ncbi:MAG: SBBP repeat-containing protein [Phycisphaerales bacterium]|nr:SBBP repeat-containing protein [Phycisphaerales bacterium]